MCKSEQTGCEDEARSERVWTYVKKRKKKKKNKACGKRLPHSKTPPRLLSCDDPTIQGPTSMLNTRMANSTNVLLFLGS